MARSARKTTKSAHNTKKKPHRPKFDAVHKASWQAAQAAWEELQTVKGLKKAAFDREVSRRRGARERAGEGVMTEPKQLVVTAEARALLAELGFVEVIEDSGGVHFMERSEYEKLLAAGKLVGVVRPIGEAS